MNKKNYVMVLSVMLLILVIIISGCGRRLDRERFGDRISERIIGGSDDLDDDRGENGLEGEDSLKRDFHENGDSSVLEDESSEDEDVDLRDGRDGLGVDQQSDNVPLDNEPDSDLDSGEVISEDCSKPFNSGYRILSLMALDGSQLITAVWYPTHDSTFAYSYGSSGVVGEVAFEGILSQCGSFPLVVFSHGFGGCGVQSLFFTEELAREGYVVVAPDHDDAVCSIKDSGISLPDFGPGNLGNPREWDDSYYRERRDDVILIIDHMLTLNEVTDSFFYGVIDESKIGVSGHSLGGYTAMGIVGGWNSWKDNRIDVVLLFSPYVQPFLENSNISNIRVPFMYQGGTLDLGITPWIKKDGGAYDQSNPPKFFLELQGAGHMAWTNFICKSYPTLSSCVELNPTVHAINYYGIAFLNKYLKNDQGVEELTGKTSGLKTYEYEF